MRSLLLLISVSVVGGWPAASFAQHVARSFREAAISPDGSRVAWAEPIVGEGMATEGTAIYVRELQPPAGKAKRISAATENDATEQHVAWAPDSKRLAFLSDAESTGQSQLYVADADGGHVRKLTDIKGFLADPVWAPDGKSVAILFTENAPRAAGPLEPMTPEQGLIENEVYEQRIAVVDVASGKMRQCSPPDLYVYEYDWAPDSKSFALTAAHGAGDSNWYVAQIYTLGLDDGKLAPVYKPRWQIAGPRWSPDGKSIAFIEGLMSDEGSTGGDIFVVPEEGGVAHDVTSGIAASPSEIFWQAKDKILFTENIDGESGISTVALGSGEISRQWSGPELVRMSFSADRTTSAALRSSPAHPSEVWVGPVGQWRQLTHYNDDVRPDWGEMKSLHWTNDGMRIQGWLLYPRDYEAGRQYPMIVVVHGGPAAGVRPAWPGRGFNTYQLSAQGYFVLYPNPRGSFGQGEKFTQGNIKDFGYGDFRDIMAGVDEVAKTLPVDNRRVGITGWSYGGYMTMWAVTQTHRFAAAVAGAGLSNWQSYYGENDIDEWMIPYFGASVYDDPAIYARSSPITFIKNVKTPTLILVGDRDGEVPEPQSREFWHALKTLGVETQFVVYPGEGHAIRRADHQRDIMERMVGWFDRYLKTEDSVEKRSGQVSESSR